jgi:hypothetical protein
MHPAQGWGTPTPATRTRSGIRLPRPLIIGLALLTIGLLFGLTRTPRGLLVIAAAGVLVALFDARRASARWLRVVVLVVLLAAAAPASLPERVDQPAARPRPPVKVETAQVDHLEQARGAVADLYQRLASGFSRFNEPAANGGR